MVPAAVHSLTKAGHQVLIQQGAGLGSSIPDEDYVEAGGQIVPDAATVYIRGEMVVKVSEPTEQEGPLLKRGQPLFTYLHLAPRPELTSVLLEKEITGAAYETIED